MPRVLTNVFCGLTLSVLSCFAAAAAPAADSEPGLTSMFNGRDLTGWEGKEGWWYVEDGAITSQSTPEKPCLKCNYLLWRGGQPGDFDLQLKYRILGGNSGIQFRSQPRPDWDTYGYQADIDAAGQWAGALFEHARGGIAMRGERVVVDENGKRQVSSLGDPAELMKHIKLEDWNEYRVTARGNEITLAINGVVMSQAIDHEQGKAARDGIIALQVHPGPPMKIQFKDLRIKVYDQTKP